ncbi:DUF3265 domain-containing protein [Vibrio splendidus]|nr:DUF3265 domain-containing protein [Vibrio splendidus]PTP41542.1 DUF3265 domain-containing protein [Vibrio splendidus]
MVRNPWYFNYALVLTFNVVYGGFGITLLMP